MTRALCAAVVALLLVSCGSDAPVTRGTSSGAEPEPPSPSATALYEGNGLVLEEAGEDAVICFGSIAASLPPQCSGTPLAGWDWGAVEGEETAADTTWGDYHVVGTYDGETLTVVEAGPSEDEPDPFGETDYSSPCPEPEGGWLASVPEESASYDPGDAEQYAGSRPDYVASWVIHLGDPSVVGEDGLEVEVPVVYNVIFTANAAAHEAEIRKVWVGPLCVVERETRSERELLALRAEAEAAVEAELGLSMLDSWGPGVDQTIWIGVVADPGGAGQAALDERYGPGVVRLEPALRPVTS